MKINEQTSYFSYLRDKEDTIDQVVSLFPFNMVGIDEGIKYLSFYLKPNSYKISYWDGWLK